ncbi:acetolactate synthase small subunit [Candidatus Dojkabacteria bacterium]|nr:acetolactate synthase small subunit [Candidatus Dojkabacteria bacterium]
MRKNYILLVFAENKPGVLNKMMSLIRKKMYNVETITACKTETKGISRITLGVSHSEGEIIEQIIRQLQKIVEVTKVVNITESPHVERELALIKVSAKNGNRAEVSDLTSIFRGNIVDVQKDSMIVEIIGSPEKIESAVKILEDFGIEEIARTGITAMER